MRRKLVLAAVAIVALVVGIVIGSSGKTKTVKKTETVTQTVTVDKTHTITVAKTRVRVPKACTAAISDAERIAHDAGSGFAVTAKWPTFVSQAAVAGASDDTATIDSLAAQLRSGTARLNAINTQTARDGLAFTAAAAHCR